MADEITFAAALREQPFDSNMRWYDQWLELLRTAGAVDVENAMLRRHARELEQQLHSAQLSEQTVDELDSVTLIRFTREHYALVHALVADVSTTLALYVHVSPDMQEQLADAMDAALRG